jgi:predicted nucleic acid-binding protein
MPDVIANTSPIQYLHQLGELQLLSQLYGSVIVPPAVAEEIAEGRTLGHQLPDLGGLPWLEVAAPASALLLPLAAGLGAGELGVLALGQERRGSLVILDDGRARRCADALGLRYTGTLGVLLKAKQSGVLLTVRPLLDRLEALGFRLDPVTHRICLALAGEDEEASS